MKKLIATMFGLSIVSACASSPDAIAPIGMGNAFASVNCQAATSMLNAERQNLAALSSAQRKAVAGDAVGVFLIGVPVSSLSGGDKEGHIATSKGKIIALESRMMSC